jgi:hypothetical protein
MKIILTTILYFSIIVYSNAQAVNGMGIFIGGVMEDQNLNLRIPILKIKKMLLLATMPAFLLNF